MGGARAPKVDKKDREKLTRSGGCGKFLKNSSFACVGDIRGHFPHKSTLPAFGVNSRASVAP